MNDRIKSAFDDIKADDGLKAATRDYIERERERREKKPFRPRFRAAFAAAAAALIIVISGGYSVYAMPTSYISIDVNPSVELTLNRFDRVLSTTAYNEDGQIVIEGQNLRNERYTDAIDMLVQSEVFAAYMVDDHALTITVASDDDEKLLAGIMSCQAVGRCGASCSAASAETVQEAHGYGMSFGKYKVCMELCQYDSEITLEDCRNMTMRELHTMLAQYRNSGQQGTGGGNGYGNGGASGDADGNGSGTGGMGGNGYHGGREY